MPSLIRTIRLAKGTEQEFKTAEQLHDWCQQNTVFSSLTKSECRRALVMSKRLAAVNK